ncbi:MAG TPA: type II toxin-antitoxin system prevent-host-death family antitoxin [Conexibacter sp.]|nr:type II toxin-antitoxin system prevent-host-death family antitoxin [Conexibacter sp.]
MTRVNVQGVQARLPELLDRVEQGERIAITRDGKEIATLMPYIAHARRTGYGSLRGQIDMSRFDEADEEIAREFGMLD